MEVLVLVLPSTPLLTTLMSHHMVLPLGLGYELWLNSHVSPTTTLLQEASFYTFVRRCDTNYNKYMCTYDSWYRIF